MNDFFDRLFSGNVLWAMHTAMTCELGYVSALKDKQCPDSTEADCAFFYDANKQKALTCKVGNPKFSANELLKHIHELKTQTTHHAKLSLICFEDDGNKKLRLAVFSRNLEFSSSIDCALLFGLERSNEKTENGTRLTDYLETLKEHSDEGGKKWLESHIFNEKEIKKTLENAELVSEFGSNADIFFGGCNDDKTLWQRLALNNCCDESIVLSPPYFIRQSSGAKTFFENKFILYDTKSEPSHIKLYLLKKPQDLYELWTGSANATQSGLGWDLNNTKASIECLVRFEPSKDKFNDIRDQIRNNGYSYFDFSKKPSLVEKPDAAGSFIIENFEVTKIEYDAPSDHKASKSLKVTLKKVTDKDLPECDELQWRPLEYSKPKSVKSGIFNINKGETVELEYRFKKFESSQGILVFGSSCCMMRIPSDKLPIGLPMKKNKAAKNTTLSKWLRNGVVPEKYTGNDTKLKWFSSVLRGEKISPIKGTAHIAVAHGYAPTFSNPLCQKAGSIKAVPMQFQTNGAKKLADILSKYSRAFLADEPGLGKTFTSAKLISLLAESFYLKEENNDKPFIVIYTAPNLAIIEKNISELMNKYNCVRSNDISIKFVNADRLTRAHEILEANKEKIKYKVVLLIGVSAEVALRPCFATPEEEEVLNKVNARKTPYSNADFTTWFLQKYKPALVIWDEFHRYFGKFKTESEKMTMSFEEAVIGEYSDYYPQVPYFAHENDPDHDMKCLFVSATPYKTNISGEDDKQALEELYSCIPDDRSPDVVLPSFNDFAKLFSFGKHPHNCTNEEYENALLKNYNDFLNNKNKENLETLLKEKMIRNERTQLQGYYEKHISCFERSAQYDEIHAEILKNTAEQCRLLKEARYPEGALKWSLSLPWILSFSTSRTSISQKKNNKEKSTYFEVLKPTGEDIPQKLFAYDEYGRPDAEKLKYLPKQNLAMYQICEKELPDKQAAQLLWVPASMPLYNAGERSIFTRYADYSKLLVFAEYRYLQRGGALLLSDYARQLCGNPCGNFVPKIELRKFTLFDITKDDHRKETLDELLEKIPGEDMVTKLYSFASPAACAARLGLDEKKLTNAFNEYFNTDGVREALWSWLYDNGYSERQEEGILRYCAEGCLYSVLEEWSGCISESSAEKRLEHICEVLSRKPSKVGVQTKEKTNGISRSCGFAEQLTGDINDVGSGEDEKAVKQFSRAFDSPFYPMVMFAGRGAQEGIDMHCYCLRIMHLTLPRGAVSYEQRNGRIDRYRSLLVRRRAAELTYGLSAEGSTADLMERAFEYLGQNRNATNNKLFPNWNIEYQNSRHHFEELMPAWEYTEESCFIDTMKKMLENYRRSMGVHDDINDVHIDLSTV